jgi:hypothetical protein
MGARLDRSVSSGGGALPLPPPGTAALPPLPPPGTAAPPSSRNRGCCRGGAPGEGSMPPTDEASVVRRCPLQISSILMTARGGPGEVGGARGGSGSGEHRRRPVAERGRGSAVAAQSRSRGKKQDLGRGRK